MTFHIKDTSLDWALQHILRYGDTDVVPTPFEFRAIEDDWDNIKKFLAQSDLSEWEPRQHRRTMAPKGRYAFRSITQLDPLDSLLFTALVYEIGPALEEYRTSVADGIVFSHRFEPQPNGQMYSTQVNWGRFLSHCQKLTEQTGTAYVVVADIADFYPRLYHHRIENTLRAATHGAPHVPILIRMISGWAEGGASYGLPVGPSACRIIADVTIDDVDQTLRSEKASFCRFSDDFRIFCPSEREAYESLELLATVLHRDHGLTLQQGKTKIVTVEEFIKRHIATPHGDELANLFGKFRELLEDLGLTDPYQQIDYEDLNADQKKLIDELNLEDLLEAQIKSDEIDIGITKFILRRLAQINDADVIEDLLGNTDHFYPVLAEIARYLRALSPNLAANKKAAHGKEILSLIEEAIIGHLPYHQTWLLNLFADDPEWNSKDEFANLYANSKHDFPKRKLILALGRSHQDFWFRTRKSDVLSMEPWQRRAFLAGASCMPADERKHWYFSLRSRLDLLEATVVQWARKNPF